MNHISEKYFPDLASQQGGALIYAMILTSVIATYAYLNVTESSRHQALNAAVSKNLFLNELHTNLGGSLRCPAGGITIKQGSCPGAVGQTRTSPIKLSIQEVRRLVMDAEGRAGIPFSSRSTGHGARDLLVREALDDYINNCDLDPALVPYVDPAKRPRITPCVNPTDLKSRLYLDKRMTLAVKYAEQTLIPRIERLIQETISEAAPIEQKKNEVSARILTLENERNRALEPIDRELTRAYEELRASTDQLAPYYQSFNSLNASLQQVAWERASAYGTLQYLVNQCEDAIARSKATKRPISQCSQQGQISQTQSIIQNATNTIANLNNQIRPLVNTISHLEAIQNQKKKSYDTLKSSRDRVVSAYDAKIRPLKITENELQIQLTDFNIKKENYTRMKDHLAEEVVGNDDRLVSNEQLARLAASPTSIKLLLLEGRQAAGRHLMQNLKQNVSMTPDKIPTYPLLLEPVCLATPDPSGDPGKYLRRLSFKAEVDPARVSPSDAGKIRDLRKLDLRFGTQRDLPLGFAPDCLLSEEDDDEEKRLEASNTVAKEDAVKNDVRAPATRSSVTKRIVINRY